MIDLTLKKKPEEDFKERKPSFFKKFIRTYYSKILLYSSIIFISYEVIFEPTFVAGLIGQWIHDFVGTLVSKSKF